VTTLTKRMSEDLSAYMTETGLKVRYLHSDVETLERIEIIRDLRLGVFDILIGINLLREGLDIPECALVAILDADKEGFLRNERSLTQTAGRAARNVDGRVIFYADKITGSMQKTIDETTRRREKQIEFNTQNNITPTTILKSKEQVFAQTAVLEIKGFDEYSNLIAAAEDNASAIAAEEQAEYLTIPQMEKNIMKLKKNMEKAARDLDFMEAARLRDLMLDSKKKLEVMSKS
jgi:excinuclease ABC subunit B